MPNVIKKFIAKRTKPVRRNASSKRSVLPSQRIFIPRGCLNPNRTAVIEIPDHCINSRMVMARPKPMSDVDPVYVTTKGVKRGYSDVIKDNTPPSLSQAYSSDYFPSRELPKGRTQPTFEFYPLPKSSDGFRYPESNPLIASTQSWYNQGKSTMEDDKHRFNATQNPQLLKAFEQARVASSTGNWRERPRSCYDTYKPSHRAPVKTPMTSNRPSSSPEKIEAMVNFIDSVELDTIRKDLRDFQNCRRKLVYDTTSLMFGSDISSLIPNESPLPRIPMNPLQLIDGLRGPDEPEQHEFYYPQGPFPPNTSNPRYQACYSSDYASSYGGACTQECPD